MSVLKAVEHEAMIRRELERLLSGTLPSMLKRRKAQTPHPEQASLNL